jgi:signal transduction histidine kinase
LITHQHGEGSESAAIAVIASGLAGWALMRLRAQRRELAHLAAEKSEVERGIPQRNAQLDEATARLSGSLHEIQALDEAKTDFFNNVSHELRSPLTLILAPREDLVAGRTPPGGTEAALSGMQRSAGRLLFLINQLLDLAKIDAGAMTIAPSSVSLPSLVRDVVSGFESAAVRRGVVLQLNGPENMASVALDASWIESAVSNLIANALRMTKRGGQVRIAIQERDGEVAIVVSDDGPGIAPEDQQEVFERFAQGDRSQRMVGGTGLGLVLVREAARLHGGSVSLVSELGSGATFTLRLPRRPVSAAIAAPSGPTPWVPSLPPKPDASEPIDDDIDGNRSGPGSTAPLALVVEDNPDLLAFIADVLSVRYRVRSARSGQQALALNREAQPDLVVSDVAMGGKDGYELCRRVRTVDETRAVPVVLVTARTDISSVLAGFEAGASDYVQKPFHGRELLARVDVHVGMLRMAQELALRERHATLGVLAASVAHHVRNPLTSLVSGLPALRQRVSGVVDAPSLELMEVMSECAERIERTTQDLLDLSRVDREQGGPYRPSDGLRAALRLLRMRVVDGVTIEDDVAVSAVSQGRMGDMNHVFMNLLDNALRAIGERGTIRVRGEMQNGFYVARIEDSGPGIDERIAAQIFEPFFTTRSAGDGTGLGLAIVKQVIGAAGGTIEVGRSVLGGASFTVRIPTETRTQSAVASLN